MEWAILIVAGLFETFWAWQMKQSDGFSQLLPTVLMLVGIVASMVLLSISMKDIPLPVAYAVWTGIGIAGTSIVSMATGQASLSWSSALFIALIMAGVMGLSLTAS